MSELRLSVLKLLRKVWKLSCSKAGSEQLQQASACATRQRFELLHCVSWQLLVSGGHVKSGGAKETGFCSFFLVC